MAVVRHTGKITRIYVTPSGDVNLYLNDIKEYRILSKSDANFEESYKLVLLAASYRYNITCRMKDGSNGVRYVVVDW